MTEAAEPAAALRVSRSTPPLRARTIGITSSQAKCDWLTGELGFDAAINYHEGDLYEQLKAAAPDRMVSKASLSSASNWPGSEAT